MSRVGKLPVNYPSSVKVLIDGCSISIEGPKGKLSKTFNNQVKFKNDTGVSSILVEPANDTAVARSMWGTSRSIIKNMVHGVSVGFTHDLEIEGVGYRAAIKGQYLNLAVGKSHGVKMLVPEGISVVCPKPTNIVLSGIDKQLLGQFAHTIVDQCPPEPYKGKGIRKKGQYIQRKEGKKAK